MTARARDRFFGRDRSGGEYVTLEVSVVALGRADVGVTELALHVHQRVAGRQPGGRRACGVARGAACRAGAASCERVLVPVARDGRAVESAAPAPALSQRPWSRWRARTGITNRSRRRQPRCRTAGARSVAEHSRRARADLDRAEPIVTWSTRGRLRLRER